ncbi:uncharacterized protein LOC108106310 [Drosophila eugracilis]|uniref:uncharacterized protein LOC108106310 n=1 Tax=Drosophila eugracilis TaxID=29029 RepID=UPI0007E7E6BE|nr:uncharacterized protein LOC108106310 [Drosophila eugracilis]
MGSGTKLPVWIYIVWMVWLVGLASGEVLQCYECVDDDRTCGSSKSFPGKVRECPNSTMCSTEMMTSMVFGKEWTRTRRGCAKQVDSYYEYIGKHWEPKYKVKDLPEGCKTENGVIYCNCLGSLCNSASFSSANFRMPVLLIFLALIYRKILFPV